MHRLFRTIREQWVGAVALALVLTGGVAVGAVEFVKLGATNVTNRTTSISNTGDGPALELLSRSGQPPLSVNSAAQVPNLNASQLEGKRAGDFAPRSGSPSYQAARRPQVLAAANLGGFELEDGVFFRRVVRAPADGTIYVTLIAECIVNDKNTAGLGLSVSTGGGKGGTWGMNLTTDKPVRIGCSETMQGTAFAGKTVVVSAWYKTVKGRPRVYSAFVQVTFDPTKLIH